MFSNLGNMAIGAAKTAAKTAASTATPTPTAKPATPAPAAAPQQRTPAPPPRRGGFGRMRMFSSGGSTGSASKRADGIAKRGKTKGTFV